jgi:hypothetical protein
MKPETMLRPFAYRGRIPITVPRWGLAQELSHFFIKAVQNTFIICAAIPVLPALKIRTPLHVL